MTKKTAAPDQLAPKEKEAIKKWCTKHHSKKVKELGDLWAQCRDWHLSNGIMRASWEATFRNWVRTNIRFEKERKEDRGNFYRSETPQQSRPKKDTSDLTPIIKIIQGGKDD